MATVAMAHDLKTQAKIVTQRMALPHWEQVFVLGCAEERVTILSQQYRAFNLVWALLELGVVKEGDTIGVVGGGIGGLTVSAAAMMKGLSVVLVEKATELMHLQRGNHTRLLHPHIYDWPNIGWDVEETALPYFNWRASRADDVVKRLLDQWNSLASKHDPLIRLRTPVTKLEPRRSNKKEKALTIIAHNWRSPSCAVVVLAVGFGLEKDPLKLQASTYWENDPFAQHVRVPSEVSTQDVLVSGVGDGAIIDTCRFLYSDFDHTVFANNIKGTSILGSFSGRLIDIENRVPSASPEQYLLDEYDSLGMDPDLFREFGSLRSDTKVVLNGPESSPLSLRACVIHRVILWSLFRSNKFEYIRGKLPRRKATQRRAQRLWVKMPDKSERQFDRVVIRHGTDGCLRQIGVKASTIKRLRRSHKDDTTRIKLYPDGFYQVTSSEQVSYLGTPEVQAVPKSSVERLARLLNEVQRLENEIEANNYLDAMAAASSVETLSAEVGSLLIDDLRARVIRCLANFAYFKHTRAGTPSTAGLEIDMRRLLDRYDNAKGS